MNTQKRHKKTLPEWIVWRKYDDGLLYWGGQGWTTSRSSAHGFLSAAEAAVLADKHGATVARK